MADQIRQCPYCGKNYAGNGFHGYCGLKCAKEVEGDEWIAKMKEHDVKMGKRVLIGVAIFVIFVGLVTLAENGGF